MTFISISRPVTRPRVSVLTRLARFHEVWRQRQALKSLDADALRDIGLERAEARAEAARPFWDAPENWYCRG